jgi:PAS domain S-box-containing protein
MPKNITEYLEETEKLNKKNKELQQQLQEAKETIDAIKAGNIDALVITDKKILKVYTEKTADKTYRILIEKMHEGAVTINEDGTILYCNYYFANMVNLPLQKVIGTKFKNFIDDSSKESFEAFFKQGKEKVTKVEDFLYTNDGKAIPVLMSINTFSLDNNFVLSIILTDLSIQNKNQEELKRRTWQLEQKTIELESVNKELAFQNEEKEKRAAELVIANEELAFQNNEKEKRAAELVIANKELGFQDEEKEKRAAELIVANKELVFQNKVKEKRAAELVIANEELAFQNNEKEKRAAELVIANKELAFQNEVKEKRAAELVIANEELAYQNNEKEKRADELSVANIELAFQNNEKEKRADELSVANIELAFQNDEKEKRAAELVIANKELAFQNEVKEKRAAELVIANEELAFQNNEKEKRAEELSIANIELAYQNDEKEKRAAELVIANKELAFQNDEKEKRAAELVIANKELAFQNKEKEKRAAELIIANKELAFQNDEKEKRAAELIIANRELKQAEDAIRKLNEELEQKVIERTSQLESANKELGSFSYSVSHDLRAPIRAINGYAKILEEDYSEKFDPEGTKVLHSIMQNSKKMGQLIDDLLAFSKLGRKEVTVSQINMDDLVKLVREELLVEEGENIPEFNIKELPPAKGDQSLIKQVWINLISNAIKYSKYKIKTNIEIGAYEKDNFVVYNVKDYGAGFDMQYYDKLFGVFQRLHSQEEFEGTGIGLAIVQKIVHRHNGTVWAESILNEGTCFYFSLPAGQAGLPNINH